LPPFIIAEMSGNHNRSIKRAFDIVDAAAEAGVDAIKLQTYKPETMTLDVDKDEYKIKCADSLWLGKSLYQLYAEAYTPWEWHKPILERASKKGVICFSSPFDETSVDFLEDLGVPAYKIASFEITHLPLIRKVARTGKPIIMSTGMASAGEIEDAVKTVRECNNENMILLKCTSSYPASPTDSNINTIPHMRKLFNCPVGISDHTAGIGVAVASVALGAVIIEKHFTLSREDGGVDSAFSLEPDELRSLVTESKRAWSGLGVISYGTSSSELNNLQYRRSIHIIEDILEGEQFTTNNIKILRPGHGALPSYYNSLIGRICKKRLFKGNPLRPEDFL
jgi:pseudaminic acid synthase